MARAKILQVLAVAAIALLADCGRSPYLSVGSKNFTEQMILGEIIAQQLELRLHQPVQRKFGLGGTLLAQQGLLTQDLDLYPEYTGTAFTNVLKRKPVADPARVLQELRTEYGKQGLEWLDPLGFNNSFAMVMRADDARARHFSTLSEAAAQRGTLILGAGYEFLSRPDGYRLLTDSYGFHWKGDPLSMDLGLLYPALRQKQVDMGAASATDGTLAGADFKVLDDDKRVFPPYEACVVARSDALARPGVRAALAELSGRISSDDMRKMNYEVDGRHRRAAEVAREFLARRR